MSLMGGFRGFRKARFNPKSQLNVSFTGECGINNKGLTQEFLTLALAAVKNTAVSCSLSRSLKKLIYDIGRQINTDLPAYLINVYRGNVLNGGYRGF